MKEMKLKVSGSLNEERNRCGIKISKDILQKHYLRRADIVEIKGDRKTIAIVDDEDSKNVDTRCIRMHETVMKNAKTSIGNTITIKKTEIEEAKKIIIAPIKKNIHFQMHPDLFKINLLGTPVLIGDIVDTTDSLRFVVVDSYPSKAVIITENTELIYGNKNDKILFGNVLPEDEINVNIKNLPDLKKYIEVRGFEDMLKLSKKYLVDKFEDNKQIVYFVGEYFYRRKK